MSQASVPETTGLQQAAMPTETTAPDSDGLRIVKFIERFDAGLIAAGFSHEQRMTIVGLMWDSPAMPEGSPDNPRPLGMLTDDESAYVLQVVQHPGCKLSVPHGCWEVPEALGLVKVVGSWKWEPTPLLLGLLRTAIATRNPGVAVPPTFTSAPPGEKD